MNTKVAWIFVWQRVRLDVLINKLSKRIYNKFSNVFWVSNDNREEMAEIGLVINEAKTKVMMTNNLGASYVYELDGQYFEVVTKIVYLGTLTRAENHCGVIKISRLLHHSQIEPYRPPAVLFCKRNDSESLGYQGIEVRPLGKNSCHLQVTRVLSRSLRKNSCKF